MKNAKRVLALMLAFVLALTLVPPVPAEAIDTTVYRALVRFEDGADEDALCQMLERLPGVSIRWRYEALFRGVAIEGTKNALALAGKKEGIVSVSLSRKWTQRDIVVDPLEPSNSLDVMNGLDVSYDGDGMVIAVLDSGLKLSHETFADHGLIDEIRITQEMVDTFAAEGGTNGRYVSVKIPFAYDYSSNDRSVHTADMHGTHVSALAVGYALREDGSVKFRGVAPAAQLLCMKVFPDNAELGADDVDILKAMEDAYLLGADVINLSLGMVNAFEGDKEIGAVYTEVIAALEEAGVVVCCAVGNEGTALTGKPGDTALPGGGYTDYATANAPAIYRGAAAIAAVNSVFYETGSGIVAGDRTIRYTEATAEAEGQELPGIDTLAGKTLEYVVIDGLGTAEDFEGLDLTGCAALVKRGEIYFSEKTRNAAAAGAVLCIIYNNEPGAILPVVDNIPIPCLMLAQEDGEYLVQQAVNGRGSFALAPERMQISTGDRLEMFSYSSWGASPSLHLVPTVSAPGGMILSAGVETNGAYTYLSGTSMAAPNASGAYALVMQALRERGVEDKTERARLAAALLESTARLVTDESEVPLSPRRQGAGVINLAAALTAEAVIEEPLLEIGESEIGCFQLRFTVKNLSDEEKRFTIDTTVLTDAFIYTENALRSTLTPLDITEVTTINGVREVRVAPMGEAAVTLSLNVSPGAQKLLKEAYPDGFYTEGYVMLTDEAGETIHATFLGYCGDWEAAPIIEQVDFRDVMDAYYAQHEGDENAMAALTAEMGYNLVLLCDAGMETYGALLPGENPWLVTEADDKRIAMSSRQSDAIVYHGDRIVIDLYTLRNAQHVIMVVSDQKTGEIYLADDRSYLPRSPVLDTIGAAASAARFVWDGTDSRGQTLRSGTAVTVAFYAWLESERPISDAYETYAAEGDYRWLIGGEYENYREWSFPLVVDASAPEVSCRADRRLQTMEICITDEHYVAYGAVQDEAGEYLAAQAYAGTTAGEQRCFSVPLSECGGKLYITAVDYAGNMVGYEVDTANASEPVRCAVAMLTDVEKDAWYHEAVDFVIENGLMTMGEDMTFLPETGALRVQVLEMLYDLAGKPEVPAKIPFKDVAQGAPYRAALEWAYSMEIVTGYDNSLFGAYAPVQRAQLAVMLYRAAQAAGETAESLKTVFPDETPEWASQALGWAVEMGYLTLDAEGNVNAKSYVTRAEFASILMKFYENRGN